MNSKLCITQSWCVEEEYLIDVEDHIDDINAQLKTDYGVEPMTVEQVVDIILNGDNRIVTTKCEDALLYSLTYENVIHTILHNIMYESSPSHTEYVDCEDERISFDE